MEEIKKSTQPEEKDTSEMKKYPSEFSSFYSQSLESFKVPTNMDVIQLEKAWQAEVHSPEILPYAHCALDSIIETVRQQEAVLGARTASVEDTLYLDIYKMELERIKFLVKDYLRARLSKIEAQLFYIVRERLDTLLSQEEVKFATRLFLLRVRYYNENVMNFLPTAFQDFGVKGVPEVLSPPPPSTYVFARIVRPAGIYQFKNQELSFSTKGQILCLPYSEAKTLLHVDHILELILRINILFYNKILVYINIFVLNLIT